MTRMDLLMTRMDYLASSGGFMLKEPLQQMGALSFASLHIKNIRGHIPSHQKYKGAYPFTSKI
jgi:hypothetical protein